MAKVMYNTLIGEICIEEENDYITNIRFGYIKNSTDTFEETPVIKEAKLQLNEYFNGKRKQFNLPLNPSGTPFMQEVWTALQTIPYGTTLSYKEVAEKIGNNHAYRAVGNANNKNPIPIIIPCHRVIGNNGKLVGYAGGLDIKQKLLQLEKDKNKM